MKKLRTNADDLVFGMEMVSGLRFTTTVNLNGSPVPGVGPGNRGLLPEPYHAAAAKAVYAVYHYETPILWQVEDGTWEVPMYSYSARTSSYRNKMMRGLDGCKATVREL